MFDRQGNRKYLNASERLAFLAAANATTDKAEKAFCLTLFYTGCRISEALNLTAGCVDISQKAVTFETLKRRRRGVFRAVPVPESLLGLLADLVAGDDSTVKIWQMSRATAYRLVKDCMKRAGITGVMASPKGCRHGFAVACIVANVPLPTVQKWMGHAKLETTAIYLGVSGDEERNLARRVWENLGKNVSNST